MKNEIFNLINSKDPVSKKELKNVIVLLESNPKLLRELLPLLFQDNNRILQKAGLILSELAIIKPDYFLPYLPLMFKNLYKNPTGAIKRNVLRILQYVPIPKKQHDTAVDLGFQYLENRQEAVAIQVFAMTVLANIVKKYPELKNELVLILEDRMRDGSAGFKSRAKKTLKLIN